MPYINSAQRKGLEQVRIQILQRLLEARYGTLNKKYIKTLHNISENKLG